jgi:hypothetical protein
LWERAQANSRKKFQQKPKKRAIGFLRSILLKCEGKQIPFFSFFKMKSSIGDEI